MSDPGSIRTNLLYMALAVVLVGCSGEGRRPSCPGFAQGQAVRVGNGTELYPYWDSSTGPQVGLPGGKRTNWVYISCDKLRQP
jgi:hypothetical protein